MKKIFFAVAASAVMLSGTAVASEVDGVVDFLKKDAYVKGTLGFADLGLDDSAIALTGTYGKRLPSVSPRLSAEVDLSFSLTDAETSGGSSMGGSSEVAASYVALAGYAVYEYPLDNLLDNLSIYGRAGLAYTSVEVEATATYMGTTASSSASDSSIDLGLGLGGKYQYSDALSFVVDYTSVGDVDLFAVGASYAF